MKDIDSLMALTNSFLEEMLTENDTVKKFYDKLLALHTRVEA